MGEIIAGIVWVVSIIVSTVVAVGSAIYAAAVSLATIIWAGVTAVAGVLSASVGAVVSAVVGTVTALSETIYKYLKGAWGIIDYPITEIAKFLKTDLGKLITRVVGVIIRTRDNVKIRIGDLIAIIGGISDVIGTTFLSDLAKAVENYLALAKAIADGNTEALLMVINDLFLAIAGASADMVELIASAIDTVWKELYDTEEGLKAWVNKKLEKLLEPAGKIMQAISDFVTPALNVLEGNVELTIGRVKGDLDLRLAVIDAEVTKVRLATEDLDKWCLMFLRAMER